MYKMAIIAAVLFSGSSAGAATLVVDSIYGASNCGGGCGGAPAWIPQFDPSLGTIDKVTVSVKVTTYLGSGYYFSYNADPNAPLSPTINLSYSVGTPTEISIAGTAYTIASNIVGSSDVLPWGGLGGRVGTFNAVDVFFSTSFELLTANFAAVTGTGLTTAEIGRGGGGFVVYGSDDYYYTGGGEVGSQASFVFTYDYTAAAVPEPAAWAMMLTGFGFVGAALRRRLVRADC